MGRGRPTSRAAHRGGAAPPPAGPPRRPGAGSAPTRPAGSGPPEPGRTGEPRSLPPAPAPRRPPRPGPPAPTGACPGRTAAARGVPAPWLLPKLSTVGWWLPPLWNPVRAPPTRARSPRRRHIPLLHLADRYALGSQQRPARNGATLHRQGACRAGRLPRRADRHAGGEPLDPGHGGGGPARSTDDPYRQKECTVMVDLRTRYLGMQLRSPLVASASPLTGSIDGLRRLEAAGTAAVVLPSLLEEQLTLEAREVGRLLQHGADSLSAALALDDYNAGPFGYLALVEKAKATLHIPVIASLNGVTPGAWVEHARLLEEAGADALELNIYYVSSRPGLGGSEVEWRYLDLVRSVRQTIGIPLAVKLSPYFSSVANMARQLVEAGADALVLFNRFYQPDLDLETLEVTPRLVLSTSE